MALCSVVAIEVVVKCGYVTVVCLLIVNNERVNISFNQYRDHVTLSHNSNSDL